MSSTTIRSPHGVDFEKTPLINVGLSADIATQSKLDKLNDFASVIRADVNDFAGNFIVTRQSTGETTEFNVRLELDSGEIVLAPADFKPGESSLHDLEAFIVNEKDDSWRLAKYIQNEQGLWTVVKSDDIFDHDVADREINFELTSYLLNCTGNPVATMSQLNPKADRDELCWKHGEFDGSVLQKPPKELYEIVVGDETDPEIQENHAYSPLVTIAGAGNIAGILGYRYIDTGTPSNHLTFETPVEGWEAGDTVSVINKAKYQDCAKILRIYAPDADNHVTVMFDRVLPIGNSFIEEQHYDSKVVYVLEKPDVGLIPIGLGAFASGVKTKAINTVAHAEGFRTVAQGEYSHAEGRNTVANYASHAEGRGSKALGEMSHAEGLSAVASGYYGAHAEGRSTEANGESSHAEGKATKATGVAAHSEGSTTEAIGNFSHAEGELSKATNASAHAEGYDTTASGLQAHSEGHSSVASGPRAHAEGTSTTSSGDSSHAEGVRTNATSSQAHAEGYETNATGARAHSEGANTSATNEDAHAEGRNTTASGARAHAEGYVTKAIGSNSHSEGLQTRANGENSHAEGTYTETNNPNEHAEGQYNKSNSGSTIHSIGVGTSASNRKNAVEVLNNGKVYVKDVGGYTGATLDGAVDLATAVNENTHAADNKIDKVSGATAGNLAALTADGSIQDSGAKSEDFVHVNGVETVNGFKTFAAGITVGVRGEGEIGTKSAAIGSLNVASGNFSVAEGAETTASGAGAHAEGYKTVASGDYSHAEGHSSEATSFRAHAEGSNTHALGADSHAEGNNTRAVGTNSHAEGYYPRAQGTESHAEGFITTAIGNRSHAEGEGQRSVISGITFSGAAAAITYTTSGNHSLTVNDVVFYDGVFAKIVAIPEATQFTVNVTLSNEEIVDQQLTLVKGFAFGERSHVEGYYAKAIGDCSHAEGNATAATGPNSHSEGASTLASGTASHAEGQGTKATSFRAHAEGANTTASREDSHAEGNATTASGQRAHAEGYSTTAANDNSHAEGYLSKARNTSAHAEGHSTYADGTAAHAEGNQAKAAGANSHAEGFITSAVGASSHAEGEGQRSNSQFTISGAANATTYITSAEHGLAVNDIVCYEKTFARVIAVPEANQFTLNATLSGEEIAGKTVTIVKGCAFGDRSHVEGYFSKAIASNSHAEGTTTIASGPNAHSEGTNTIASGTDSHAEGNGSKASSYRSHAEGVSTTASGQDSHAEGAYTTASGSQSHAEGFNTKATNARSHAEGANTTSSNEDSHAEGRETEASGQRAHAEGAYTTASGVNTHAEGNSTKAIGPSSHAEGISTIANNEAEHSQGKYNVSTVGSTIHSIGIGTGPTNRRNAVEVLNDGKMFLKGVGGYDGTTTANKRDVATVINALSSVDVSAISARLDSTSGMVSREFFDQTISHLMDVINELSAKLQAVIGHDEPLTLPESPLSGTFTWTDNDGEHTEYLSALNNAFTWTDAAGAHYFCPDHGVDNPECPEYAAKASGNEDPPTPLDPETMSMARTDAAGEHQVSGRLR